MSDLKGLLLTLALIGLCFVFSYYVKKKSEVVARKIIHIGVSNFAFIYLNCFTSFLIPFTGLLAFALINALIELNQRKKDTKTNWGTVEYPLIIALLVLCVNYNIGTKEALACALLGMGYGDGFAALAGQAVKSPLMPFCKKKTTVGSLTVFLFVLLFCVLIGDKSIPICLICALAAMLAEVYTPFNLDNLSVPLVIFVIMGLC